MFRDEEDLIKDEISSMMEVYSLNDIMVLNDMNESEAVYHLYIDGHIVLPEVKPI